MKSLHFVSCCGHAINIMFLSWYRVFSTVDQGHGEILEAQGQNSEMRSPASEAIKNFFNHAL